MSTERSDSLHESVRQASEKFDYFVLGVIGAVCAYISQTIRPMPLGFNPSTLELLALLALFGSGVFGFLRIEASVTMYRANYLLLRASEERGNLTANLGARPLINTSTGDIYSPDAVASRILSLQKQIPEIQKQLDRLRERGSHTYRVRNWLLVAGFLGVIAAKVWLAYV